MVLVPWMMILFIGEVMDLKSMCLLTLRTSLKEERTVLIPTFLWVVMGHWEKSPRILFMQQIYWRHWFWYLCGTLPVYFWPCKFLVLPCLSLLVYLSCLVFVMQILFSFISYSELFWTGIIKVYWEIIWESSQLPF